jgi:phosphinothricin acetyltransferase
MDCQFAPLSESDRKPVVGILNHFIENSFAALPEDKVGEEFFDRILEMTRGYPALSVRAPGGEVAGFAFLRAYHPTPTLRRTAEITYFLAPEHTGKGIGGRMLEHLVREARELGIDNLLAKISSLNEASIRFHRKMGFEECGRFRAVGRKFGRDFDLVWMQKKL